MITAIVIPVDPDEPLRLEELEERDFEAFRRLVDGSLEVQHFEEPPATMYFNAEGKVREMPVNHRATALLWVHHSVFRGRDVIVGPAFVVGPPDHSGLDGSAPQDLIDLLLHTRRYGVQALAQGETMWRSNQKEFTDWFDAYLYVIRVAQRWSGVQEVRVVPELDDELRETWYQLGMSDPWIRKASDPPFSKDSFNACYSVEELAERIGEKAWPTGTAFYYRDLGFIQWVSGGDEWFALRHGIVLESFELIPYIQNGTFASLVHRLLAASKEQAERREY